MPLLAVAKGEAGWRLERPGLAEGHRGWVPRLDAARRSTLARLHLCLHLGEGQLSALLSASVRPLGRQSKPWHRVRASFPGWPL